MNDRKTLHIRAHYYLALMVALCLPIGRLAPVFIALMFLNWLLEGEFRSKFRTLAGSKLALLFIAFYLLHLIGMIYTENTDAGWFDLQVKLSLIILPLIIASRPFNEYQLRNIFMMFIAGGIISSLILLSRAVFTWFAYGENNFFYQAFTFLIHPSYLSMYFCLCIAWLLYNLLKRDPSNGIPTGVSIAAILFFSFINVLLSSKMGLLGMFLVYFSFLVGYIVSRKKYIAGGAGVIAFVLVVFCLVKYVPEVRDRFNAAATALSKDNTNQAEGESTAVRMLIWKAGNKLIGDHLLFGVGTGDAKQELVKEYKARGMSGALEHQLNAHNEFYQVFISLGLVGFTVFIISLLIPAYLSFCRKDVIYFVFLVLMMINFIPESMFETQAGVMFYAFFNSLLCFRRDSDTQNQHITSSV
ncbi:MAG: O-antigen ligase family protein [Bacteroidia bacterium]